MTEDTHWRFQLKCSAPLFQLLFSMSSWLAPLLQGPVIFVFFHWTTSALISLQLLFLPAATGPGIISCKLCNHMQRILLGGALAKEAVAIVIPLSRVLPILGGGGRGGAAQMRGGASLSSWTLASQLGALW